VKRALRPVLLFATRLPIHPFPRRRLGVYEFLAYPWVGSLEWLQRYLLIVDELETFRKSSGRARLVVLDFGGGSGLLAEAMRLYHLTSHYEVVLADIDAEALAAAPTGSPLGARLLLHEGGAIPLSDGSVDLVVSSDVFEHIPSAARPHWAREIDRVARLGHVHSIPTEDPTHGMRSEEADAAFQAWHVLTFGRPDRWTTEHLAIGAPDLSELRALFPGARVRPFSNVDVWLESIRVHRTTTNPIHRMPFLLRYLRSLRGRQQHPPFKSSLVVVNARQRGAMAIGTPHERALLTTATAPR
jgi:SAM-dependent methyltransferase